MLAKYWGSKTLLEHRERYAIPIGEESIRIGKREVREGGKRIRTYVRETPVEEQVTLRDEEVHVERRPVNRAATEADFQEQNIEMSETHEEAVVLKQARVVEEVTVEKEAAEHTETVRGTERRTEVEVFGLNETEGKGTWRSGEPDVTHPSPSLCGIALPLGVAKPCSSSTQTNHHPITIAPNSLALRLLKGGERSLGGSSILLYCVRRCWECFYSPSGRSCTRDSPTAVRSGKPRQ